VKILIAVQFKRRTAYLHT